MRVLITLLLFAGLLGSNKAAGQTAAIPDEIFLAFKAGNVEEISKYLNSTIELVILDNEDFYTKKVAEGILKEFFKEHQTNDFIIKHKGGKTESSYAIGNLKTQNGNFRVYFLIKRVDSKPLIHQLRIEKDSSGGDQ